MNIIRRARSLQGAILSTLFLASIPATVNADRPGSERFQERIPVPAEDWGTSQEQASEWLFGVGAGVTVFFFDEESGAEVFPALYANLSHSSLPLNFRAGVEFGGFDSKQATAEALRADRRPFSENAEVGFIRVPFSVEGVLPVGEDTTLYAGPGVSIIRVDDLPSDTTAGLHLSARAQHNFTDMLGLSVEGGYLWADADLGRFGDLELDGAFISTLLVLNF